MIIQGSQAHMIHQGACFVMNHVSPLNVAHSRLWLTTTPRYRVCCIPGTAGLQNLVMTESPGKKVERLPIIG